MVVSLFFIRIREALVSEVGRAYHFSWNVDTGKCFVL